MFSIAFAGILLRAQKDDKLAKCNLHWGFSCHCYWKIYNPRYHVYKILRSMTWFMFFNKKAASSIYWWNGFLQSLWRIVFGYFCYSRIWRWRPGNYYLISQKTDCTLMENKSKWEEPQHEYKSFINTCMSNIHPIPKVNHLQCVLCYSNL